MVTADPPRIDPFDALAIPLSFARAWTKSMGEMTRASISAWSALARSYGQASEACAALLGQAIDLEGAETLALTDSADRLLQNELHALEVGTEHLVYVAEDTLTDIAGGPLVPLPE